MQVFPFKISLQVVSNFLINTTLKVRGKVDDMKGKENISLFLYFFISFDVF